ncbi:MAG: hypothetical protein O7F75_08600 [Alphaproteobacteria bacterium]|nr:hypothetical protein [Alphaproteobacteria bacterium]
MAGRDRDRDPALDPRRRQLRSRNLAVLAVLGALALLFYVITIVKMGGAG